MSPRVFTTSRGTTPKTPIGRSRRCARDSAAMSRCWSLATNHSFRQSSELRNPFRGYQSSIARNAPRLQGRCFTNAICRDASSRMQLGLTRRASRNQRTFTEDDTRLPTQVETNQTFFCSDSVRQVIVERTFNSVMCDRNRSHIVVSGAPQSEPLTTARGGGDRNKTPRSANPMIWSHMVSTT